MIDVWWLCLLHSNEPHFDCYMNCDLYCFTSRFSHDSDSDCGREVAVNDGQYLKLPATFNPFLLSTIQRCSLKCIILGQIISVLPVSYLSCFLFKVEEFVSLGW